MAVGGWDRTNWKDYGYSYYRTNKDEILHLICQEGQDIHTNEYAYPYRSTQCQWQEYPKKLGVARDGHVVIPLPASYEICNN